MIPELFNNDGYQSAIIAGSTPSNEEDLLYLLEDKGLQSFFLPAMGRDINLLLDFKAICQVYRIIRKYKPDIVHTHTAKTGLEGCIAARLAGIPIIIHTFHGNNFSAYFGKEMSTVSILTDRFLARLCSFIIAISEQQKRELLQSRKHQ